MTNVTHLVVYICLITGFACLQDVCAQNTKEITQTGQGHTDVVVQSGNNQSAELNQHGQNHRAFLFQHEDYASAILSQFGFNNAGWLYQLYVATGDSSHQANISQTGLDNRFFIFQRGNVRAELSQQGADNTAFIFQKADSSTSQKSHISVDQSGNGNTVTIIQGNNQ